MRRRRRRPWPARPPLTRTGGRIVVLGVLPQGEQVPIEPFDLLFREIQLHFAFINPFTQARAADLIAAGRIAVEPLISRIIPLAEAAPKPSPGRPRPARSRCWSSRTHPLRARICWSRVDCGPVSARSGHLISSLGMQGSIPRMGLFGVRRPGKTEDTRGRAQDGRA